MGIKKALLLFLAFAVLHALSACRGHYPVYGRFQRHDEGFRGVVQSETLTGLGTIAVEGTVSGVRCVSRSKIKVAPPGERGSLVLDCSDGRIVVARYVVTGWGTGRGTGQDQNGDRFRFTFGVPEGEALRDLTQPEGQ